MDSAPEFRNLLVRSLAVKNFLKTDHLKRKHCLDSVIHVITSLNRNFYRQGKKALCHASCTNLRRARTVEARECLCETFRRFVAVSKGNVDYFLVCFLKVNRRPVKPPVPDVFPDSEARHKRKSLLKKERRHVHLGGNILRTDVVLKMIFHKINSLPNASKPFHPQLLFP